MYARGDGVFQDWIRAYAWLDVAAANGSEDAARMRNTIALDLTDEQFAAAIALGREFTEKYRAD
jgi:TPR repeat protein